MVLNDVNLFLIFATSSVYNHYSFQIMQIGVCASYKLHGLGHVLQRMYKLFKKLSKMMFFMIILRQKSQSLPAFSRSIDSTSLLLVHMMQKVSCDWTDDIQNITYKYWSILKLKSIILCETDHWTDQSLGYCLIEADIKWLTHKQLGTNWCKISPAATDGLVLWQCWLSVYCFTQDSLKDITYTVNTMRN